MSLFSPSAAPAIILACVKNGPADLGAPGVLIGGVAPAHEVVLADGTVYLQGVASHVRAQRSVGPVHIGMRAWVDDDRQLGGRHDDGGDPAEAPDLGGGGHEDRRRVHRRRQRV